MFKKYIFYLVSLFISSTTLSHFIMAEEQGLNSNKLSVKLFEGEPVPESFEKLIEMIQKKLEQFYAPATIQVEKEKFDGRSLDQDFDSVTWARRVVSFTVNVSGADNFVPLFVGYAPKRGRLEIISFIPGKGYEFLLVDHFIPSNIGNQMNLSTDQILLCSSCHQAGAPIFSKFPWNESEGTDDKNRFSKARINGASDQNQAIVSYKKLSDEPLEGDDGVLKIQILNSFPQRRIEGEEDQQLSKFAEDGRNQFPRPFNFDRFVRLSNRGVQIIKALNAICKPENTRCRKIALTLLTLNSQGFVNFNRIEELTQIRQEFLALVSLNWDNENSFSYVSSVLPDRNLVDGHEGNINWLVPLDNQSSDLILNSIYNEDSATTDLTSINLGKEITLPGYRNTFQAADGTVLQNPGNPQVKRPNVRALFLPESIATSSPEAKLNPDKLDTGLELNKTSFWSSFFEFGLSYYFGITSDKLKITNSLVVENFSAALLNDNIIESLLQNETFDSEALISRLNLLIIENSKPEEHSIGSLLLRTYKEFLTRNTPEQTEAQQNSKSNGCTVDDLDDVNRQNKIKQLSHQFCSACHGQNSELKLPLDSPKQLSLYKSQLGKLAFNRIKDLEMPPQNYKEILAKHYEKEHPDLEKSLCELSEYLRVENEKNLK